MQRCSEKAFAMCPTRHLCGSIEDATFSEFSECAAFNKSVEDKPMTNADRILNMSKEEMRNALIEYFSKWADIGDSYIFDLTRVKEAFAIGTMDFEDFVEWDEERIAMLVDEFLTWLQQPAEGTPIHGGFEEKTESGLLEED